MRLSCIPHLRYAQYYAVNLFIQVIPGGNNKKYLNFYTDEGSHSKCRLHVFHCQGNDVVTIAAKLGYASHEHAKNKLEQSHKVIKGNSSSIPSHFM